MIINMQSGGVIPERILDAQTIIPGTTDQTLAAGSYLRGAQTIKGDPELIPENIKADIEIFGKVGTFAGEPGMKLFDMDSNGYPATIDCSDLDTVPGEIRITVSNTPRGIGTNLTHIIFKNGTNVGHNTLQGYTGTIEIKGASDEVEFGNLNNNSLAGTNALNTIEKIVINGNAGIACLSEALRVCHNNLKIKIKGNSISHNAFGFCGFSNRNANPKIWFSNNVENIDCSNSPYNGIFYQATTATKLYCEANSEPSGWDSYWNYRYDSSILTTMWGVSESQFDAL